MWIPVYSHVSNSFGINFIPLLGGRKDGAAVQLIICIWFFDHLSRHLREAE